MKLILFVFLLVAPTVSADWDQKWVDEAIDPEQIIHRIRVVEGLYSRNQLPYLFDLRDLTEDYDEILRTNQRIRWILSKNEFNEDNYRRLSRDYTFMISNLSCLERSDPFNYYSHSVDCNEYRYFLADSYIGAIETRYILAKAMNLKQDWEEVIKLVDFLSWILPDIDGSFYVIQTSYDGLSMVENPNIKHKYRPSKYRWFRKIAQERLEAE